MHETNGRSLILVSSHDGAATPQELEQAAARGERPRKDFVELARVLDADILDGTYMRDRATPIARLLAKRASFEVGQLAEALIRGGSYAHIVAWADRLGLPLATAHKLARRRRDLVMLSVWLTPPKKALLLKRLKVYTHLRAIIHASSVQLEFAARELGVPRHKLHHGLLPVDEQFWHPGEPPTERLIAAAGSEGRDYLTLVRAVRGVDVQLELAVGNTTATLGGEVADRMREVEGEGLPANVRLSNLDPRRLRSLYARSRFLVVPLQDVDYDAGMTAIVEAMAMGKAVVVTRTRGQVDVVREGEHGLYVPPEDPQAMRKAIEYLLAHPEEAERMGRAGRALIEERHTLDAYINQLAAIARDDPTPGGARFPHDLSQVAS